MSGRTIIIEEAAADAPCVCSNCEWKGSASELSPVTDCTLTPGDPSPAGRCPEDDCDSLAYLDRPVDRAMDQVRGLYDSAGNLKLLPGDGPNAPPPGFASDDTHGMYTRAAWMDAIGAGDTRGYWEWVKMQIEDARQVAEQFGVETPDDHPDSPTRVHTGEFSEAITAGYALAAAGPPGDVTWLLSDPGGSSIGDVEGYPTEREAWQAADNHRMFGSVDGPQPHPADVPNAHGYAWCSEWRSGGASGSCSFATFSEARAWLAGLAKERFMKVIPERAIPREPDAYVGWSYETDPVQASAPKAKFTIRKL